MSLEVAPDLANDTDGTVAEARRLWYAVKRPNLMIKVPGTRAGFGAVRTLLTEGINVNVTLLFSRGAYAKVVEQYVAAIRTRHDRGEPIDRVASVASFFVSRIDSLVDQLLESRIEATGSAAERERLRALEGRIAIANAKLAYRHYESVIESDAWRRLAEAGARPQRLLWASTSTKNPAYRDTLYVEELIGPDTVNTIPPETLAAFRDHGVARTTLTEGLDEAKEILAGLEAAGISLREVTHQLLAEGLAKFVEPFEKLLVAVETRTSELLGSRG